MVERKWRPLYLNNSKICEKIILKNKKKKEKNTKGKDNKRN